MTEAEIETVARAICAASKLNWDILPEPTREAVREDARAAIRALDEYRAKVEA